MDSTFLIMVGILAGIGGLIAGVLLGFYLSRDEKRLELLVARDEILMLKVRLEAHELFVARSKVTAEELCQVLGKQ